MHNSQVLNNLLEEKDKDQALHANSVYTADAQDKIIAKYELKIRVRVEHILDLWNRVCTV